MTTVVLLQAAPADPATGGAASLRLAGGGSRPFMQLGFSDWRDGITAMPRFSCAIGFDQAGLTGGALPQTAGIRIFPSDKTLASALGGYYWIGARVTVSIGDDEAPSPTYPTFLTGTVSAAPSEGGAITLTVADLSVDLDKPIAPDTFAGTGGIEGVTEATGRVKRRSWGYVFNVEGRLLDKPNRIYEFGDPSKRLQAFPAVKDKGREASSYTDVAWAGSVDATFTALQGVAVPAGGCARAPSIACVKWWTTPAGPLTADIQGEIGSGYVETVPAIAARLVSIFAPSIAVANLAEALGWQSAQAGIHADEAGETVAEALDRLLPPVSVVWILDGAGNLNFRRLTWSGPIETLTADTIVREQTFKPLRTRSVGYGKNHRVHNDGEISAALLLATDAAYADGTPIEDLKPIEVGSDVTLVISGPTTASPPIARYYDGMVKEGELPRSFKFTLTASAADVSASATWNDAVVKSGAATVSNDGGGVFTVSAATAGAVLSISATYNAKTRMMELALTSAIDPPPSGTGGGGGTGGGTSASTSSISSTTSSSYGAPNSPILTVKPGTAGKVELSFPASFRRVANGNNATFGKWQISAAGAGAWSDVGPEVSSTVNAIKAGAPNPSNEPGSISVNMTATGLTTGADYDFQLLLRNNAAVENFWDGVATASGS